MPTMTSTAAAVVHHEEEEEDEEEEENMSIASSQLQSPSQIEDALLTHASRSANPSQEPTNYHLKNVVVVYHLPDERVHQFGECHCQLFCFSALPMNWPTKENIVFSVSE